MTSSRERQQRAAARARLARQMAERQAAAKRRRQRMTIIGAAAAVLVLAGGTAAIAAAVTGGDAEPAGQPSAAPTVPPPAPTAPALPPIEAGACTWYPEDVTAPGNEQLTEVGTPPAVEPGEGISTMTLETNLGVIEAEIDVAQVPCTVASLAYLADQEFYDGSSCHRLTTEASGILVLQCGDPTGTGGGGPTYRLAEENLPVDESPTYPKGTVAMAKTAEPSTTGSQFFLVYEDTELPPDYTVLGTVTEGMDIVDQVAADGLSEEAGPDAPEGPPSTEVVIETLRISDPA